VNPVQHILIFAIRAYRWTISPVQLFLFGSTGGCRYTPTCSQYAVESVQTHGALSGSALAARRICRCHPWGGCGHDPVPPSGFKNKTSKFKIAEFVR
jgi:uncharacterized protein